MKTPVELANVWSQFLGRKFATTDLECIRAEYETLPARKDGEGDLTRAEFDSSVKKMKAQKTTRGVIRSMVTFDTSKRDVVQILEKDLGKRNGSC